MSISTNRTAVDVAPATTRPGLALLLALLAVPGSTWAWDLPLGGLWIGLPLAVAAIVISGLCIAQMVVYTIAVSVS